MFSFKTLHIRPKRFLPVVAFTAAFLLLLEIGFRVGNWFYDYEGWESPALMKKMEDAEELFKEEGRIDLVTLSSSIGRAWDVRQWEEATSGSIVAYNFGYPGQRPEKQYFLFKRYIFPKYKPGHVIYGISPGDVNSNVHGMHPDHPKQGPFWTYRKIRSLGAKTLAEKAVSELEEFSLIFRGRKRARFELQHGPLLMLQEEPTIGHGVLVPTVRRQAYGPLELSWGRRPEGFEHNDLHNYWIPDEGEIGELLKLDKFCKENGVKMAIVEFPYSPYGLTNYDDPVENHSRFVNALDHLEVNGAWVLRMAEDLNLDNTYFEDQAHLNRWGGQMATDYVYQHVITKWFPEVTEAPSLPAPVQYDFEDLVTTATAEELEIKRMQPATPEAQYAAQRQVLVTSPMDIVLTSTLSQGSYAIELYAGDGTTTTQELTGEARMELAAVNTAGEISATMPIDEWINSRVGISYTQVYFTVPATSTLVLRIKQVADTEPLILDSVFIRPRLSNLGDEVTVH